MTVDQTHPPSASRAPVPVSPSQLAWLDSELHAWRTDGLLEAAQADAIRNRYRAVRRLTLARLILGLGAGFVGVGLIWLVGANLDALTPQLRFAALALIWIALLAVGEGLAIRSAHAGASRGVPSPVVGAVRAMAALAFGAVVFQAAQSLQVPAYEPLLVSLWGLGAVVHAYAVRGVAPLVVGLPALAVGYVWESLHDVESGVGFVAAAAVAGVVAAGVAAAHRAGDADTRGALGLPAAFAAAWRELAALLMLVALFTAAVPDVTVEDFAWNPWLIGGLLLAAATTTAAGALGSATDRMETLVVALAGGAGVLLVLWDAGADRNSVGAEDWAHAAVSVAVYVLVAAAVAVAGVRRDSWRLTTLALAFLVVFTTFQSFAVFAQIIDGAWLFLVLGVIFLGTGFGFDRARRQLAQALEAAEQNHENDGGLR